MGPTAGLGDDVGASMLEESLEARPDAGHEDVEELDEAFNVFESATVPSAWRAALRDDEPCGQLTVAADFSNNQILF